MNAHLMACCSVVEFRVVDQVGTSVFGCNDAVVALSALSDGHVSPVVVCAHDELSPVRCVGTEVSLAAVVGGLLPSHALIGAIGI